tara:strand:- start:25 stop:450 length:426 start_codon:yes stop_codon:yes gene_type:complete
MINKVILIGNLGRDPDIRFSSKGEAIANLALATSESWKDKDTGEKVEKVEWHRVVVFGKLADVCQKYLHKGSKIYVEGKLQTRKWDKNGVDQYTTEVVLSGWNCTLMMLDSKVQPVEPREEEERPKIQPLAEEEFEDDIPF